MNKFKKTVFFIEREFRYLNAQRSSNSTFPKLELLLIIRELIFSKYVVRLFRRNHLTGLDYFINSDLLDYDPCSSDRCFHLDRRLRGYLEAIHRTLQKLLKMAYVYRFPLRSTYSGFDDRNDFIPALIDHFVKFRFFLFGDPADSPLDSRFQLSLSRSQFFPPPFPVDALFPLNKLLEN